MPSSHALQQTIAHDLNQPQREAVLHHQGPLLVLAGAGSGKTRVITYRIAKLLERGTMPHRILALTFTNKAAGEMRRRAEKVLGGSAGGLWIGTFHGICARLLRTYGVSLGLSPSFTIYDSDDQRTLIKRVLASLKAPERIFTPRDVLSHIDRAKNKGIGPAEYKGTDFYTDLVEKAYRDYEAALRAADAVDFGNLLLMALKLFSADLAVADELADRFDHVLVDEFQDTNRVQYDFVRKLSERRKNLCVVGDDDQSIYGWRGADIRNILDFEKDHPEALVVKLEQNYRSSQNILDGAWAVIKKVPKRKDKKLWTARGAGELLVSICCADERDEAREVVTRIRARQASGKHQWGDFAVFYRTHAQSRALEEAFRAAKLPHSVVGGVRFFERAEIKDMLAYLRLAVNPADDLAFERVVNNPPRGIGAMTVEKLREVAKERNLRLLAAARLVSSEQRRLLKPAAAKSVAAFCQLIDDLATECEHARPADVAELALERSGYLDRLAADDSVEAETRRDNVMELIGSLREYEGAEDAPTLSGFLEQVTLASEVDSFDQSEGTVTLMTVHSAKGLEFPVVFLLGLERGVFPHFRSLEDESRMEEERRLAYVAITRAECELFLLYAQQRFLAGQRQVNPASPFLTDLPFRLVEREATVAGRSAELAAEGYGHTGLSTDRGWSGSPQLRPSFSRSGSRPSGATSAVPRGGPKATPTQRKPDEVWVDYDCDYDVEVGPVQTAPSFRVGMKVRHKSFGLGEVRAITGNEPDLNLTIVFRTVGPKTVRSHFVTAA